MNYPVILNRLCVYYVLTIYHLLSTQELTQSCRESSPLFSSLSTWFLESSRQCSSGSLERAEHLKSGLSPSKVSKRLSPSQSLSSLHEACLIPAIRENYGPSRTAI